METKHTTLLVAPGERDEESACCLMKVADMLRAQIGGTIAVTYLAQLETDLTALAAHNEAPICVAPLFWYSSEALREDIADAVAHALTVHPDALIRVADVLGADERLAAVLAERLGAIAH